MSKVSDFLANAKSDALAFNAAHGKLTACILALVAGYILGKIF